MSNTAKSMSGEAQKVSVDIRKAFDTAVRMDIPRNELLARVLEIVAASQGVSAPAVADWQPIETAPKDGKRVLLWWPYWVLSSPIVGWWQVNGGWQSKGIIYLTPLPA